jgi:cellulose synthase/poly-beta-1,6-N-acetylglucosamine synthase-like glycosyltransferase
LVNRWSFPLFKLPVFFITVFFCQVKSFSIESTRCSDVTFPIWGLPTFENKSDRIIYCYFKRNDNFLSRTHPEDQSSDFFGLSYLWFFRFCSVFSFLKVSYSWLVCRSYCIRLSFQMSNSQENILSKQTFDFANQIFQKSYLVHKMFNFKVFSFILCYFVYNERPLIALFSLCNKICCKNSTVFSSRD